MKKYFIFMYFVLLCQFLFAQNTFRARIISDQTNSAISGATASFPELKISGFSDTTGLITIQNIPNGKFKLIISYVGMANNEDIYDFPLKNPDQNLEIRLEPQSGELAEVNIQTTRTNQNLRDIPTRIEALPYDELDEKATMRPGDIKMLLGETTGIHVQQTSAVSGSASFRIQGLDSRYTQLLQDGMPLYAGFSGNLSLMQVSPLNLRQVEFIKGSSSTLYGGGAIAGLVNLISKEPQSKPELTVLLNGTSAKGIDASSFYSQKWKHLGTTLYGAYNYNGAYDPSRTGFSAIPLTKRITLNPKLFLYMDKNNAAWLGINSTYEDRLGGDMRVISAERDSIHQYFEQNKSYRFSTQLSYTHNFNNESKINFKNTIGYFDRRLEQPGYSLHGKQLSSYSEFNYVQNGAKALWVTGLNFITDDFKAQPPENRLNYHQSTLGIFLQNTFKASKWFSLETGIRLDKNSPVPDKPTAGIFLLPRVNALFRLNNHFTSRIGGGYGYKMPGLFNDLTEQDGYQNIKPIVVSNLQAETSRGLNADINYRGSLGDETYLSFNQLFFYTTVYKPLILQDNLFINAPGYLNTKGTESNIKLAMDELTFYIGYTYTDTKEHFNGKDSTQPLTPKNQISFDATYEIEGSFRFGVESFYTGSQLLHDGTIGKSYLTFGLLVQKMWKHFDIYINAENLSDRRQTRWGSTYTGSIENPTFKDIYAPLDGVVINGGIRIKFFN